VHRHRLRAGGLDGFAQLVALKAALRRSDAMHFAGHQIHHCDRFLGRSGSTVAAQPYDTEKGAGTMSPHHGAARFVNAEPWRWPIPSPPPSHRRLATADNPNRAQATTLEVTEVDQNTARRWHPGQPIWPRSKIPLQSGAADHDNPLVEDKLGMRPPLGAWGWAEVWLDGMEFTQCFTPISNKCAAALCRPPQNTRSPSGPRAPSPMLSPGVESTGS